jgi:5-methylcytosine-specific restriction protein B
MARNPANEHLYKAYQDFAQLCLVEDRSLLWPNRAMWTPTNVSSIRHALVDTPHWGKETFENKLVDQMAGLPSDVWGLLADAYYLYCLVPNSRVLKTDSKLAMVSNLAKKGSLPVPDEQDSIWNAMVAGFCNPGQRYLQKYRQFWLIFVFAEQVKQLPDRLALLKDRQALQKLLDASLLMIPSPVDRAADMRNALLYLAFPEYYEPYVSTGYKSKIVTGFKDRLPGSIPTDVDDAIYQIRKVLEKDESLPKPMEFYQPEIEAMWRDIIPPLPVTPKPAVKEPASSYPTAKASRDMLNLFQFTKNVIIYGPPGTGKTFIANQVATQLVKKQLKAPIPDALRLQSIAEDKTLHELMALGMYLAGKDKRYLSQAIQEFPLIQSRFAIRPIKFQNGSIWSALQIHTSIESTTVNVVNKTGPTLFDKDTDARWYLTPSGKEYVEQNLSDALTALKQSAKEPSKAEDFITRVAFHQSYAYEDFVEGFRPSETNEIAVVPGKFREVCAQAASNPLANYVFIIDEINRGNISKIFGELITLLEDDKRAGQPASFPVELAYSHMKFMVPGNLYIIGTMNTADRSIALLDVALRRRFAFYELLPDPSLLHGKIIQSEDEIQVDLEKLLQGLNERIFKELGADYQIGHSYLLKVDSLGALEFAWNNQILPLLQEYFYSQPERLHEILEPYLDGQENGSDLRMEGSDLVLALSELTK